MNRAGNAAAAFAAKPLAIFWRLQDIMRGAQGPIKDFMVDMIAATQRFEDFTKIKADSGEIGKFFKGISENAGAILGFLKRSARHLSRSVRQGAKADF